MEENEKTRNNTVNYLANNQKQGTKNPKSLHSIKIERKKKKKKEKIPWERRRSVLKSEATWRGRGSVDCWFAGAWIAICGSIIEVEDEATCQLELQSVAGGLDEERRKEPEERGTDWTGDEGHEDVEEEELRKMSKTARRVA